MSETQVERLRKMASCAPFADNEAGLAEMAAEMREAADTLDRLEAIVAKLPRTADRVVVVPWMRVYGFDADGNVCETVIGDSVPMCDDGDPQGEPFDEGDWFFGGASGVFSTPEAAAALAAKAKG